MYISKRELCLAKPTLMDLNLNELHYYPCLVDLDRCNGSFNILNDLSSSVCILNKKEGVNFNVFNMIARIYESKALAKHISCNCKYKFDGRNGIKINVDVNCKNPIKRLVY